jgi:hypothetical protein
MEERGSDPGRTEDFVFVHGVKNGSSAGGNTNFYQILN